MMEAKLVQSHRCVSGLFCLFTHIHNIHSSQGVLEYSPVIYLPHGPNQVLKSFVVLATQNGGSIHMTPDHLIAKADCNVGVNMLQVRKRDKDVHQN